MGEVRRRSEQAGETKPLADRNDSPYPYSSCYTNEEIDQLIVKVYDVDVLTEALQFDVDVMRDPEAPIHVRQRSAENIRNRRFGKEMERRQHSGGMLIEVLCDGE